MGYYSFNLEFTTPEECGRVFGLICNALDSSKTLDTTGAELYGENGVQIPLEYVYRYRKPNALGFLAFVLCGDSLGDSGSYNEVVLKSAERMGQGEINYCEETDCGDDSDMLYFEVEVVALEDFKRELRYLSNATGTFSLIEDLEDDEEEDYDDEYDEDDE